MATTTEREIKIADGLGNADASQVLYGATFSSEDGFNIEGTFVPDASNITYNDTTVEVALDELVESTNNLPSAGTKLIETLPANETTVTFTSDEITENTTLNAVYTSIFGVKLESANVENGVLTLTFEAQEEDMTVVALINATMSDSDETHLGDIDADEVAVDDTNLGLGVTNVQGALEKLKENAGGNVKSAYQYAVDGGYEGTETEFMALMGGLGAYEGESSWELWGSATGTNKITLPTEYTEVMFIVRNTSGSDMTTRRIHYSLEELTILKDDYLKFKSTSTETNIYTEQIGNGSSDSEYYLTYYFNDNSIAIKSHKGETPTDIYQLSVYYKKKNGVTVDYNDLGEWKLFNEQVNYGSPISNLNTIDFKELYIKTFGSYDTYYPYVIPKSVLTSNQTKFSNGSTSIFVSLTDFGVSSNGHYASIYYR